MANTTKKTLSPFEAGIANIHKGGELFGVGFKTVCNHIIRAKTYDEQQELIKLTVSAYTAYKTHEANALGNKDYTLSPDSARKAITRGCKAIKADFKVLPSDKPEAVKKQRVAKAGGKALRAGVKAVDKKPTKAVTIVKDGKISIGDVVAQIKSFEHALEMVVPSKNVESLRAATIAYLATVQELCK